MGANETSTKTSGFSDFERAAMKERAQELKAEGRRRDKRAKGEQDLLGKLEEMPEADRVLAERVHEIVSAEAPHLMPKTWYGMPAYANDEGKVVCFFQGATKFEARYATLGFNDAAMLDDGDIWPTAFALTKITPAVERQLRALVKQAAGAPG
jgi:uncharacterized protein YdhG (YjbR/CyaY superfamily)